jgi:adenylosuccinate synthase
MAAATTGVDVVFYLVHSMGGSVAFEEQDRAAARCVADAAAGAGVGPDMLHYILGITKAYTTRVGSGPFPTELPMDAPGSVGHHLSTVGQERGTVTGRPRRCGWLDAASLRRSIIINGLSGLCITKLDVLDTRPEIKVCVGY